LPAKLRSTAKVGVRCGESKRHANDSIRNTVSNSPGFWVGTGRRTLISRLPRENLSQLHAYQDGVPEFTAPMPEGATPEEVKNQIQRPKHRAEQVSSLRDTNRM
jgi:hypothetical protein